MDSTYHIEIIAQNEHTIRFRIKNQKGHLTFTQVFKLWADDIDFNRFYVKSINKFDYKAFYWEHPALTKDYLNKKYECIIQRSKPLEHLPIDKQAFSAYISSKEQVVDFMNLGGNARLIVPTNKSNDDIYNHLAKFLKFGEEPQVLAVFQRLGTSIREEIEGGKTIWLNTAGLGVIWLHIRMDTRPKYYKTANYKRPDFLESLD